MNYQEMSEEQIEFAVSDALNIPRGDKWCSDWAETGPIIQDNGINLMASKVVDSGGLKEWEAMSYEGNCHHWGELNPLRAAMIVFLMMKGGE